MKHVHDHFEKVADGIPGAEGPVFDRAGRFFVYGAHDAGVVPHGVIPIRIEAGLAFGTGHHETTALCLRVLSDLSKKRRFANVLDLGCGTGLLAIGAAKLWRRPVLASDIDVVAVEVTRENAAANGEAPLIRASMVQVSSPDMARRSRSPSRSAVPLPEQLWRLAPQTTRPKRGASPAFSTMQSWFFRGAASPS